MRLERITIVSRKVQQSMNAVMKNPGQLRMMCYKAEIVLGIEAWYFLHGTTGGVCNLFYFLSLLSKMQTVNVQLGKRGQHYTVKAGQADGSLLGLSREWRIGRKVVRRLLDDFAERGIISVESNPLTSLVSLVCVRSWLAGGRLVENPLFRPSVGKFEGVKMHLLNGQQFGTLRRSAQRCGSKSRGKGGATDTDSCSVPEPAMRSVSDAATGKHAFCRSDNIPALRSESRPADSTGDCAVPTSGGTTQSSDESTPSGYADIDHL